MTNRELIECCERHTIAYHGLIHQWVTGRIDRYTYDSLWQTLKLASLNCTGVLMPAEFDADINEFAL